MVSEQFHKLAGQGYNRIPIMREFLADLETPLSAYLKLADGPYSYLFESVQGGEKWGRYSIIGLPAKTVLKVSGYQITLQQEGQVIKTYESNDPLAEIESFQKDFKVPEIPGLPKFCGGLVGYFGYDCIAYIEPHLDNLKKQDPLQCPDILLMVSERVLVFDNLSGKLYLIVHADPNDAHGLAMAHYELDLLCEKLLQAVSAHHKKHAETHTVKEEDFKSSFQQEHFEVAVKRIKQYIAEGDAMQVVLSQRMSVPFYSEPIQLYRALRSMNPSPYMYYLNLQEFHIVGSSPEILVRCEEDTITVRPIAGTRPRGQDEAHDRQLEKELLADPKELAEHVMLIDLGRNDVGRVAKVGTVELTDKMLIERYSHVMHIVSNVIGTLSEDKCAIDVLRASFPAGTVSGAPKIRAMEIINELEPVKRGIYAGAIGYLSWTGAMDTAIAIRTAVIKDKTLYIQAGAGIVADSIPQNEWDETMNKGRAIFRAVAMAESGLNTQDTV